MSIVAKLSLRAVTCFVLLIGLALALVVHVRRRAQEFRDLAAYHWSMSAQLKIEALGIDGLFGLRHGDLDEETLAHKLGPKTVMLYKASKYHGALCIKYRGAAVRPWLPVQYDPPTPYGYHWTPPSEPPPEWWSDPYESESVPANRLKGHATGLKG